MVIAPGGCHSYCWRGAGNEVVRIIFRPPSHKIRRPATFLSHLLILLCVSVVFAPSLNKSAKKLLVASAAYCAEARLRAVCRLLSKLRIPSTELLAADDSLGPRSRQRSRTCKSSQNRAFLLWPLVFRLTFLKMRTTWKQSFLALAASLAFAIPVGGQTSTKCNPLTSKLDFPFFASVMLMPVQAHVQTTQRWANHYPSTSQKAPLTSSRPKARHRTTAMARRLQSQRAATRALLSATSTLCLAK